MSGEDTNGASLCCWGLSFKTASVEVREGLGWSPAQREQLVLQCAGAASIKESLVLATCNRAEIYVVSTTPDIVFEHLAKSITLFDGGAVEALNRHGYKLTGEAAIRHMFSVAASLDAMVVGETQIQAQVKNAYEEACTAGTAGPHIHRLFQRAFTCAKRIRQQTGIGTRPVSVGSVAVELAQQIFGDLKDCALLLIGLGEMSRQVVRHVKAAGIGSLLFVNRTESSGEQAAQEFGARSLPWERMDAAISEADIVLAATGSNEPVVTRDTVAAVCKNRRRPLFFLDIAVPRNIESAVGELADVYLYDIDDLRSIAEKNVAHREAELEAASAIVEEEAQAAWNERVVHSALGSSIAKLHQKCDAIRREELERTLARFPECRDELKEAIGACTNAIVSKILHDPIIKVKEEARPSDQKGLAAVEWLRRLFRLDETV